MSAIQRFCCDWMLKNIVCPFFCRKEENEDYFSYYIIDFFLFPVVCLKYFGLWVEFGSNWKKSKVILLYCECFSNATFGSGRIEPDPCRAVIGKLTAQIFLTLPFQDFARVWSYMLPPVFPILWFFQCIYILNSNQKFKIIIFSLFIDILSVTHY